MRERHQHPTHHHTRPNHTRLPALLGAAALAGAGLAFAAGPAWADCAVDIGEFDAALVAGGTGSTTGGEMPATRHEEQVLSGSEATDGSTAEAPPMETAAGDRTGEVEALSPHQRDVIRALNEDQVDEATRDDLAIIISEARAALQNGDEAACQEKIDAARELVRGG